MTPVPSVLLAPAGRKIFLKFDRVFFFKKRKKPGQTSDQTVASVSHSPAEVSTCGSQWG